MVVILRGRLFICLTVSLALLHYGAGHIGALSTLPGMYVAAHSRSSLHFEFYYLFSFLLD